MECSLPAQEVRCLYQMIKCVYTIGDELFIETDTTDNHVMLRALNSSHSAFVAFKLKPRFFKSIALQPSLVKCKVASKTILSTFKAFTGIDEMRIQVSADLTQLTLHHQCKHDITKRYHLALEDCEVMQAVYDRSQCRHHIKCSPRLLSEYIQMFPSSVEEISFVATTDSLKMESYVDSSRSQDELSSMLGTSVDVNTADMQVFDVMDDVTITFCLKEFKAVLSFCESQHETISIHFDCGSRPLLVTIVVEDRVEGDFVIATLFDADSDSEASSQQATQASSAQSVQPAARLARPSSSQGPVNQMSDNITSASSSLNYSSASQHDRRPGHGVAVEASGGWAQSRGTNGTPSLNHPTSLSAGSRASSPVRSISVGLTVSQTISSSPSGQKRRQDRGLSGSSQPKRLASHSRDRHMDADLSPPSVPNHSPAHTNTSANTHTRPEHVPMGSNNDGRAAAILVESDASDDDLVQGTP